MYVKYDTDGISLHLWATIIVYQILDLLNYYFHFFYF